MDLLDKALQEVIDNFKFDEEVDEVTGRASIPRNYRVKSTRKKASWSEEEEEIIKNNWKSLTDVELSKGMLDGYTPNQIASKRYAMGLKKTWWPQQKWSEEEKLLLLKHWKDYNQKELQQKFFPNKTVEQVRSKKMDMGLKKGRKWSDEEISILQKYGSEYNAPQLNNLFLPNKTPSQIRDARKHYGGIKYRKTSKPLKNHRK
tara:strand:- start:11078 stop:11686 length:609 start_codon:yes stop_codon:yes gene_type:complete